GRTRPTLAARVGRGADLFGSAPSRRRAGFFSAARIGRDVGRFGSLAGQIRGAAGQPGCGPVAAGGPGAGVHSDPGPACSADGRPASASASTACAAVTPDPQYTPTGAASLTPSAANRARSACGARNRPSGPTFWVAGALTAPGMWPATGSTGSRSPR